MFKNKYILLLLILLMMLSGCTLTDPVSSSEKQSIIEKGSVTETSDIEIEPEDTLKPEGELIVHFIDVGQGDSILIQTPVKTVLIDAGDRGNTVVNYLRNLNIKTVDISIGTHPHADHIGGFINIFESFNVNEVIDPGIPYTTKTFEDYLVTIDQKNIKFTEGRAGMKYDLGGGASMKILHPVAPSSSQGNNASIVARITFGDISFLLTGDAENLAETGIINRGYNLNSTVLKVGHHGSRTSTSENFLQAADPEVAIIMCGANNQYGHPHDETLKRLSVVGVDTYRTDLQGTIVINTDGYKYSINKEPVSYQEQAQPPPNITGEFLGSSRSDKYHYPECRHAKNISSGNLISFDSVSDAQNAGYSPCGVCKPPN